MCYDEKLPLSQVEEGEPKSVLYAIISSKTHNIINILKMLRWAFNESNLRINREKSKKEYIVGFGIKDIKTYFEFIIDSSKNKDYIYMRIYDKYGAKNWRSVKVIEIKLDKNKMYSLKYSFKLAYNTIYDYILYVFNNKRKKI